MVFESPFVKVNVFDFWNVCELTNMFDFENLSDLLNTELLLKRLDEETRTVAEKGERLLLNKTVGENKSDPEMTLVSNTIDLEKKFDFENLLVDLPSFDALIDLVELKRFVLENHKVPEKLRDSENG
jgi:hypothetical protein